MGSWQGQRISYTSPECVILRERSEVCNRKIVRSLRLCVSLLRKLCGGCYFLVPNKKVTKEVGLGEALTVKPIGTSSVSFRSYPDFKPSSPKTLSRPPSLLGYESIYYAQDDVFFWFCGWESDYPSVSLFG